MKLYFKVKKEINLVLDYLTDMQKFVSVHPVIYRIDNKENERYLIHETLKLGLIPFSFSYPVTVESNHTNRTVIYRATVFKFTKIKMEFVLKTDGHHTLIEEDIEFKSPLPVKNLMQNIFRNQHILLFRNIEKL